MSRGPTKLRDMGARVALAALVLSVSLASARPVSAAGTERLAGRVTDPAGRALAGVEILILAVDALTPVATAKTGADGGFDIVALLPGSYRYAALKQGYGTFIGRIDTAARRTLDVVLHPAEADGSPRPEGDDGAWALRVPRRGVLHERDPGALDEVAAHRNDDLRIRVDQLFAGSAQGQADAGANVRASETAATVDSALGARGDLHVTSRVRRASSEDAHDARSGARRAGEDMALGVSYALDPAARIDLEAHYDRQEVALEAALAAPWMRELRRWGYAASYERRIDEDHQLEVGFAYDEASLALDDRSTSFGHRAARVSARLSRSQGSNHRLSAKAVTAFAPELELLGPASGASYEDWAIALDVSDEWTIAGPFKLITGVGYRRSFASTLGTVAVPHAGFRWSTDRFSADAVFSWHAAAPEEGPTRGGAGFASSLSLELMPGVTLEGSGRHEPFLDESAVTGSGSWDRTGAPAWFSAGDAELTHGRISLVEARGYTRSRVQLAGGRVRGQLAPLLDFGPRPEPEAGSDLAYREIEVGLAVPALGTDVSLGYHWISAAEVRSGLGRGADRQESLELRVRQDLAPMRMPGDWRLLVALHVGSTDSASLEQWAAAGGGAGQTLAALDRRVGAGLSVDF